MSSYSMCFACCHVEPGTPPRCPACGHSAVRLLHNTDGLALEDLRAQIRSVASSGDRNADLKRRWVITFALCMKRLRDPVSAVGEADVVLFWVRLWGIVVEFPGHFEASARVFGDLSPAQVERLAHGARAVARWHHRAAPAVAEIRRRLSDDMLVYLEWRRHVECHTKQSAFMVQLNGKPGAWKNAKLSSHLHTLQRRVSVEEAWSALERISAQYGENDDHAVARAVAQAIDEPAYELVDAWRAFHPW